MNSSKSLLRSVRGKKAGTMIVPSGEAESDLSWWLDTLNRTREMSLLSRATTASVATDASRESIGYILEVDGERIQKSLAVNDMNQHINVKELEALLRCLQLEGHRLEGRRVVWYTDNVTARAAVMRQGTQQIGQETWAVTKKILDILESRNICILAKHVPGSLNRCADSLSRESVENDAWNEALKKITREWGPLELDLFGFTKEPSGILEDLHWAARRTLIEPPTKRIAEVLNFVELVLNKEEQRSPPSLWESCTIIITPTWMSAPWWTKLSVMRTAWLELGRIPDRSLAAWESRNFHAPSWTASLCCTKIPSGHLTRSVST